MKVKVFYSDAAESLEENINEFLTDGEYAEIIDIKFSTSATALPNERFGTADPLGLFSALVLYREKVNPAWP